MWNTQTNIRSDSGKTHVYLLFLLLGIVLGVAFGAAFIRYIYPVVTGKARTETAASAQTSSRKNAVARQRHVAGEEAGADRALQKNALSRQRNNAIVQATRRNQKCVVGISVTKLERVSGRELSGDSFFDLFFSPHMFPYYRQVKNMGSGIVLTGDGLVLTNYHVVQSARALYVHLPGGQQKEGTIVGIDPQVDLALIDMPGTGYSTADIGDSDDLYIGEWVIAIGNPFGIFMNNAEPSVTVGVVSATGRDFAKNKETYYQDMIQTDAAINPGNSGGPLVNAAGEVVGINTFIYAGNGDTRISTAIGFAIPINNAMRVVDELRQYGERRPVWTGIAVSALDKATALRLGYEKDKGVIITSVVENSPAEKAGLRENDIIVRFGPRVIFSREDLQGLFVNYFVGDTIPVTYVRDGNTSHTSLVLEQYGPR
jgi:serine protease Do